MLDKRYYVLQSTDYIPFIRARFEAIKVVYKVYIVHLEVATRFCMEYTYSTYTIPRTQVHSQHLVFSHARPCWAIFSKSYIHSSS